MQKMAVQALQRQISERRNGRCRDKSVDVDRPEEGIRLIRIWNSKLGNDIVMIDGAFLSRMTGLYSDPRLLCVASCFFFARGSTICRCCTSWKTTHFPVQLFFDLMRLTTYIVLDTELYNRAIKYDSSYLAVARCQRRRLEKKEKLRVFGPNNPKSQSGPKVGLGSQLTPQGTAEKELKGIRGGVCQGRNWSKQEVYKRYRKFSAQKLNENNYLATQQWGITKFLRQNFFKTSGVQMCKIALKFFALGAVALCAAGHFNWGRTVTEMGQLSADATAAAMSRVVLELEVTSKLIGLS
ncbi:hypothetical protein F5Y11DRAFT_257962 [Daldinia sp. FL1419]|nr:hypothetical protein F5Y11DRAFT_257962 [Daldinia sp. FL1419]